MPLSSQARDADRKNRSSNVFLYASVGPALTTYALDADRFTLTPGSSVTLPVAVQYVWPHPSSRYLYVASSDGMPANGPAGENHYLSAFCIDPAGGALRAHGETVRLPARPIHISTDVPGDHVLVAFNRPSDLKIFSVRSDGAIGQEVRQPARFDFGVFAHHVRVTPDNRQVIFVARGNDAAGDKPEDPGSLKVFDFRDGVLGNPVSVAPNGGFGFGPRDLDFHPSRPLIYVSLERQNRIKTFGMGNGRLEEAPQHTAPTLVNPRSVARGQMAGVLHVHPGGRFLYGVNRMNATETIAGKDVLIEGENNLVVYALADATGWPSMVQHIDSGGINCRTFHIDPSGRMLVAAHPSGGTVRDGDALKAVPACLSVFRIDPGDGTLEFVRNYDIDVGARRLFWMGMVAVAA